MTVYVSVCVWGYQCGKTWVLAAIIHTTVRDRCSNNVICQLNHILQLSRTDRRNLTRSCATFDRKKTKQNKTGASGQTGCALRCYSQYMGHFHFKWQLQLVLVTQIKRYVCDPRFVCTPRRLIAVLTCSTPLVVSQCSHRIGSQPLTDMYICIHNGAGAATLQLPIRLPSRQ